MASQLPVRPKPARSEGYPGIIFYTFLVMAGAVGMIAYEVYSEYDQQYEVKPLSIPKPKPVPYRGGPGSTSDPVSAAPVTTTP